jgi:hypothetical protein
MSTTLSDLFADSPGEFFISVEVFITTTASSALPKVAYIYIPRATLHHSTAFDQKQKIGKEGICRR